MSIRLTPFPVRTLMRTLLAGGASLLVGCGTSSPNLFASGAGHSPLASGGAGPLGGSTNVGGGAKVIGGLGGTLSGAGGTGGTAIGSGGSGLIVGSGGQTSPSGGTQSTGGVQTGSGGQNAGGGASAMGGGFASGGSFAVGGAFGTGGANATGGVLGSGGTNATGGVLGTGGAQNTGGQASGGTCVVQKLWATGFAGDPTQVDANNDSIKDWRLRDGSSFQVSELNQGVWHAAPNRLLSTNPPSTFSQRVLVDIRLRHPGSESDSVPALFWINVASNNPPVVSIAVEVRHVGGSQTLRLLTLDSMNKTVQLYKLTGLPDALVDVQLDIDPSQRWVELTVAGIGRGTFQAITGGASPQDAYATLWAGNGGAEFGAVSVKLCSE